MFCYLEFKLHNLKILKLFTIRVRELFEHLVFAKKAQQVSALFKSIFLRKRSLSNAGWLSANMQACTGREICINWKSIRLKWKFAVQKIITVIWVIYAQKRFFWFKLTRYSWQNINFSRNCSKFHNFTKTVIGILRPTAYTL